MKNKYNKSSKMIKSTTEWVDVDVDVEIDLNDIIEYITYYADDQEKLEIMKLSSNLSETTNSTLYDLDKSELLREAFNKFSLDELHEIFDWKQGFGITKKLKNN